MFTIVGKGCVVKHAPFIFGFSFSNVYLLGIKIKGKYLYSFIDISGNFFPKFRGFILDDPITIEYFPEDHINKEYIFQIVLQLYGFLKLQKMNIVEGSLIPFSNTCRSIKGDWKIAEFTKLTRPCVCMIRNNFKYRKKRYFVNLHYQEVYRRIFLSKDIVTE